jgi:hypothetical protein
LRSLTLLQDPTTAAAAAPLAEDTVAARTAWWMALRFCTQLRALHLHALLSLDAALLCAILPSMPNLAELILVALADLDSLHFLATASLSRSLTSLTVSDCRVPFARESPHLHGLRSLRKLRISMTLAEKRLPHGFIEPLLAPFKWPQSRTLFPHLTECECGRYYYKRS